MSGVYKLTRWV